MNQIVNMIMRLMMRKMVSKGIDAGFEKAANMRGRKKQPQGEIDDYGNPVADQQGPSRADVRKQRQAKKQARQARQAMKVMRRTSRL